jgi:hypothetical protein
MTVMVLRSFCCGVAAAVVSAPGYIAAMIWWASRSMVPVPGVHVGEGEVGWDLLTFVHDGPGVTAVWFLAAFAIWFLLGFRYFSKRKSLQTL